jgi:hypothetical protein
VSGFYLMHRGWQDNPVFRNEDFSRRDAFVWLVEEAAFRPTKIHAGTGEIELQRGQLSHSLRFMAKAWKWDEAKVRRFLSSLVKAEIIDAATDAGQTVITIRNYELYQTPERQADAADDAAATQQRRGGDAKKKEGKEVKNPSEAKASSGTRPTVLPADFTPTLNATAQAIVDRWPPGMLEHELVHFRDRATAKGQTYRDWQAAFRTWISNAEKWRNTRDNRSYHDRQSGWAPRDGVAGFEPASLDDR